MSGRGVRQIAVVLVVLYALVGLVPRESGQPVLAQVPGGATLTVISDPADIQRADTGFREPGVSGATLNVGDRVFSGAGGQALITFFDGSEVSLDAEGEIMIRNLEQRSDGGSLVGIGQTLGTTFVRVAKLVTPSSSFQLATPSALALVRGTELQTTVTRDKFQIFRLFRDGPVDLLAGGKTKHMVAGQVLVVQPPAPATATPTARTTRTPNPPTPGNLSGGDPVPFDPVPLANEASLLATAVAASTQQALGTVLPTSTPVAAVSTQVTAAQPTATPMVAATAPPTPTPTRPPLNPRHIPYGVQLASPDDTCGRFKSAGFEMMWGYTPWANIMPARDRFLPTIMNEFGQPTANDLTNLLNAAKSCGVKFVFRLDAPVPGWAGGSFSAADPSTVESYMTQVLRYGGSAIAYVIAGNEWNLSSIGGVPTWGGSPNPERSADLVKAVKRAARAAGWGGQVIAPAPAPRTGPDVAIGWLDWERRMLQSLSDSDFDLVGVHPYIGSFPPETDPAQCQPMCLRIYEELAAVVQQTHPGKQLAVTELGVLHQTPTDLGGYEWMELPPDQAADFMLRSLRILASDPRVVFVLIHNGDYASTPWTAVHEKQFSWLDSGKSPRPVFNTFSSARHDGRLP